METLCQDYDDGLKQLKEVAKRRQYRGYQRHGFEHLAK